MRLFLTIISYCGHFLLFCLDPEPTHHFNPEEFGHSRPMCSAVRQIGTEPLLFSPLICLFWIQMRRRSAICSSPSDVTLERGGESGEEAWYPGRSSSLLCRPGGKQCSTLLPSFGQRSERYWKKRSKRRKIKEMSRRRREVCILGTHSSPLLSSWQTSYLTQLIAHLITVSA